MNMRLPNKISPCPIIDSLLEFRFLTNIPPDAVFGIIYNSFKDTYKKYETLPILQLPEPVRRNDPNLRFKPYYKISNDTYVIQIGADLVTISSYPKYVGWEVFQNEISSFISTIRSLSIIEKITRIGLRVVNYFPNIDIFKNSNISINISEKEIGLVNALFRNEYSHENNIISTLNVTNNASINLQKGSIIDIDTFREITQEFMIEKIIEDIKSIHINEKQLFFSLLKEEFLNKFNPEY